MSATHLVDLSLRDVPHFGYISPTALVICLSTLAGLKKPILEFESPRSCPDRDALTYFKFKGVSECLEDLVARIGAPLLDCLVINLFHQLVFDTPHISQFFSRTPKFKALDKARIIFEDRAVRVTSLPIADIYR
jgi:hypothetical protein